MLDPQVSIDIAGKEFESIRDLVLEVSRLEIKDTHRREPKVAVVTTTKTPRHQPEQSCSP